jgi:integrase
MEDKSRLKRAFRGHKYELAFGLALGAGLRVGEILPLQGEDFDLARRTVTVKVTVTTDELGRPGIGDVTKTPAGERTVPLEGIAWDVVRRRAPSSGPCFPSPTSHSGVVLGSTLWRAFQKILIAAGMSRRRVHDLRHYFATGVVAASGPLPALSRKLGHTKQTFTGDVYVDVSPEMMRSVPDAVDELFGDGTEAPWPGAANSC